MGRALVACAGAFDVEVVGVIASAHSPAVGQDAGEMAGARRVGVPISTDLGAALRAAQVVIDFSLPHAARDHVDQCALARAAVRIPLLVAPNTSLGVTLLLDLVQRAARALPADFDVSIAEAHHRAKKDAPSGTALALGRSVSAGREGAIEYAVVRGGDVVGEHFVRFLGAGEEVSLGHRATDRAIFARGALQGAIWLADQKPGRYSMLDVIGINSIS